MNFLPKNTDFFKTFLELSLVVKQAGEILLRLNYIDKESLEAGAKTARKLELKANDIRLRISEEADSTFITPIDREDIHMLARNLDDIIDRIEDVFANIDAYGIIKSNKDFDELSAIVVEITQKVHLLIKDLSKKAKKREEMKKTIGEIYKLENKGDELHKEAVKKLFTSEKNTIQIMKWNELFRMIEDVLNTSEETAHTVNEIIVKNY